MHRLTIGKSILWALGYFCIMLLYTAIDIMLWRVIAPNFSVYLNIIAISLSITFFIILLVTQTNYKIALFENASVGGIILAIGTSLLFFLLLDNFLDPIFESVFPLSELTYQETIITLIKTPIASFLSVCILAPIIEEILIRGFILSGLKNNYGATVAILVSSVIFSLFHFNMVQTLSAFICGLLLGLLYLKTNSILNCIIAHFGYNLIAFIIIIVRFSK